MKYRKIISREEAENLLYDKDEIKDGTIKVNNGGFFLSDAVEEIISSRSDPVAELSKMREAIQNLSEDN